MKLSKVAYTIKGAAVAVSLDEADVIDAIRSGALVARKRRNKVIVLTTDLACWIAGLDLVHPSTSRAVVSPSALAISSTIG